MRRHTFGALDMTTEVVNVTTMSDTSPIQRAIEAAGSQAKLAELSGFSQQLISKLLTGDRKISATTALGISRATGGKVLLADLMPEIVQAVADELAHPASEPAGAPA